jgi:polysaccharide biosynthesis transport protein
MNDSTPTVAADPAPPTRLVPVNTSLPATRNPYLPPGGYNGPAAATSQFGEFLEYWRIIKKRKWLILGVISVVAALGILWTLLQTPLYTSTVRIQIERNSAKIVEGGNVSPVETTADHDFLKTQYELLLSRTMAERVVSALKLGSEPDFLKPRTFPVVSKIAAYIFPNAETTTDKRSLDRRASTVVIDNRQVRPVSGSRLVDVTCSDPSPVRSQNLANAYADAFIASTIDKRFEANSYAKTFLDDQSRQLKVRLEESEKLLLEFAEKEQIIVVNEKSSIAENNLAAANAALGSLISERTRNEQQWKQVESATAATADLPQFLNNLVVSGLRAQRNALVTDYQEKLQTFKPAYPVMMEINQKIREIDRQLTSEIKSIKSSLKGAYESSLNQEQEVKRQIEKLRDEVLDLQKRSIQYNALKRDVDTNRSLYNSLLQRFKEVDIAGGVGTNNVFIVDRAVVPLRPSSPSMLKALGLALFLGLGLGVATAYVLELLDDTVRSADEIERISGLTTLGVIPKVRGDTSIETEIADPRSALSESYRSLSTSLQFTTDSGLPKTLVITSSGPSEGKSITSLAIARHFATVGLRVLLVDADLRKPSLHTKMGLDNSKGLSNYLTGALTPPDAMQPTALPNLSFMASGPLPPNAADLLGSARLLSLLTVGLEVFDLIVLDGPPVMGLADAQLLSSAAQATIFVVGSGQARTGSVRVALKRLEMARAPIIGTVLTKYDSSIAAYGDGYGYGYGYKDGYGYGYGKSETDNKPKLEKARSDA